MDKERKMVDLPAKGYEDIFKISKLHLNLDNQEEIEVVVPVVRSLPEITISTVLSGTRYTVTGEYAGTIKLEDKISQIIKRDMEV